MENVGIDLGENQSHNRILAAGGELIEKRILTESKRFRAALGGRPKALVLIEVSTEREWVARCVEGMGPITATSLRIGKSNGLSGPPPE